MEKSLKKQTLKKKEIIRGYRSFQGILQEGKKFNGKVITVFFIKADEKKVGFFVSRQYKKAVQRNKIKRRMREAYRKMKEFFPPGYFLFYAKHFNRLPRYKNINYDLEMFLDKFVKR